MEMEDASKKAGELPSSQNNGVLQVNPYLTKAAATTLCRSFDKVGSDFILMQEHW